MEARSGLIAVRWRAAGFAVYHIRDLGPTLLSFLYEWPLVNSGGSDHIRKEDMSATLLSQTDKITRHGTASEPRPDKGPQPTGRFTYDCPISRSILIGLRWVAGDSFSHYAGQKSRPKPHGDTD